MDLFSSKVLEGNILLVMGMYQNHGTFENRTVFFKSLDAREQLFLNGGVVMLGTGELEAEESDGEASLFDDGS